MKRFNAHVASGDVTDVSATAVSGTALFLGSNTQKVSDLSAVCTVTPATSGLTFTARWQGSNDASTWSLMPPTDVNPALLPIATGTAAATTTLVPAPAALHAYQYARCQLLVGGDTGTDSDLYSIGYTYRVPRGQARRN